MARNFVSASSDNLSIDSAPVTAVPVTMACWFRHDNVADSDTLMALVDKDVNDNYFSLAAEGNVVGDPVRAYSASTAVGSAAAATSAGFTAGTWHHACGVWAAGNSRAAYLDGAAKGTNATSVTPAGIDRLSIGAHLRLTPFGYMSGRIAEAAVWNVALSDAEVRALARGIHPLRVRPGNLVFYAPLWGTSSPERDYTRGQRHLTVTGATVAAHPRVALPVLSPMATPASAPAAGTTLSIPQGVMRMHGEIVVSSIEDVPVVRAGRDIVDLAPARLLGLGPRCLS